MAAPREGAQRWKVVGGSENGGIIVRTEKSINSKAAAERLNKGALVEQVQLIGERLQYQLVTGTGPAQGWISLTASGKKLVVPMKQEEPKVVVETQHAEPVDVVPQSTAGCRVRWAVDIESWAPKGESDGDEFQFLLSLIYPETERDQVMKMKFFEDRKRALISRLLVRQASASALSLSNFSDISVKRTKGKKPFLASPLPDLAESPNWNVNVSHEGSWVVCASEPIAVVGIDVADSSRRVNKKGEPLDFRSAFASNLTSAEWNEVDAAGSDPDKQYETFSRFWSAKEAFVKARGDGLAFELGGAEFQWQPLAGFPEGTAYEGKVLIHGRQAPQWRFVQHRMPGERRHWTTVGRGPLADIIDAHGEFRNTLRKPQTAFSAEEWQEVLLADSPPYDIIPVGALVPSESMGAYVHAGGTPCP